MTTAELRSEAAIYAEGTSYRAEELVSGYLDYELIEKEAGREPDDFQRWAEKLGIGA